LKCRDVDVEVEVDDSDDTAHYVSLPWNPAKLK
jgi:hypothetical protein